MKLEIQTRLDASDERWPHYRRVYKVDGIVIADLILPHVSNNKVGHLPDFSRAGRS